MRKPLTVFVVGALAVVGVGLAVVALALAIMALGESSSRFHAQSRLKLEVMDSHQDRHPFPSFDPYEYEFMKEFLKRPENRSALAAASGITEKEVNVDTVAPVRGTSLFYITCSGPDSNQVQSVAANAAHALKVFYATNQPSWAVTYIDTVPYTPPTVAERLKRLAGL